MSVHISSDAVLALRDEFAHYLERAYEHVGCPSALEALNQCLIVLDTLALTTAEYEFLRNRLRITQRYSLLEERGAARFELRLLLRSFAAS
jgi:hypothetical protein